MHLGHGAAAIVAPDCPHAGPDTKRDRECGAEAKAGDHYAREGELRGERDTERGTADAGAGIDIECTEHAGASRVPEIRIHRDFGRGAVGGRTQRDGGDGARPVA